ncbi:cellulose binding domain-containing protein [Dactylosporangium sp. NPDC051541]|uniref:cellulose binding domain-containing protein n=1 Tax=Dactylosporangium sp. NPDC051541 TaxID=3363977 RepID=UPI0037BA9A1F
MQRSRTLPSPLRLAAVTATALFAGALLIAATAAAGPAPAAAPSTPAPSVPNISPMPPSTPTNFRATAATASSVTLAWDASTRGCCAVSGYDIGYMPAFNDYGYSVAVGNVTTTTINTSPGTEYRFWISAHDDLGHRSGTSQQLTVVTPVATSGDTTPPAAPANLAANPTSGARTTLTWSVATDNVGVTGYNVYRFDGWFTSTLLGTTSATSYSASVVSARDQFYVRARDAAGNVSIASNVVFVTGGSPVPGGSSSGPAPSSSPPAPPLSCRGTFTNTSVWASGFVADVTVTNTGTTPIVDWVITFSFGGDQHITQSWNASWTQTAATATLTHATWNRIIPPGGSVTVGMYGTRTAPPTPPVTIYVNGVACSS